MSSGGGGGGTPNRDLYQETAGELRAKRDLAPSIFATEAEYDPQYNSLELTNMHDLLFGTDATTRNIQYGEIQHGWQNRVTGEWSSTMPAMTKNNYNYFDRGMNPFGNVNPWVETDRTVMRNKTVDVPAQAGYLSMAGDVAAAADNISAQSATRQRTANINDYMTLGPQAMAALQASDPETAKLMNTLTQQSQDQLALGTQLDPSQMRLLQQSVRAGQAARGMGYGPADNYAEALGVSQFGQDLRTQRQQQAAATVGLRQSVYGDPTSRLVGSPGANNASSMLSNAYGITQSSGPRLFGSTINANDVADSNFNAANARAIADRNADAAETSAYIQGGASLAALAALAFI